MARHRPVVRHPAPAIGAFQELPACPKCGAEEVMGPVSLKERRFALKYRPAEKAHTYTCDCGNEVVNRPAHPEHISVECRRCGYTFAMRPRG